MRYFALGVMASALVVAGGCGDPALNRSIEFYQFVTTDDPANEFDVDIGRIPADWIEERVIESTMYGDKTHIRLRLGHRVTIAVIPQPVVSPTTQPLSRAWTAPELRLWRPSPCVKRIGMVI